MSDARTAVIDALAATRPRDRFVRRSLAALLLLLAGSWVVGGFDAGEAFSERRLRNLARFLQEVRPFPLQGRDWDTGVALGWARDLLADRGYRAALHTLAISILAIVLAAAAGIPLSVLAARTLATPEPYLPGGRPPGRAVRAGWRVLSAATRALLIGVRSVPEYLWAFLLVAILGPIAWPAVLALAVHNAGILGRLTAETLENLPHRVPAALRGIGASRAQVVAVGLWPAALTRFLLYFFYRWETCVREATVLGMLGVVSLGYWIDDARARGQHDAFLFLVLLGACIVLAGDLVSALARRIVRRAS